MIKTFSLIVVLNIVLSLPSCSILTGDRPQAVADEFLPGGDGVTVEVWIDDLQVPWSLVFLTKDRALVSERRGRILLIEKGKVQKNLYAEIEVAHTGEAGLLGLAVHPGYPKSPYIYAMYTYQSKGKMFNRIIRLKDEGKNGRIERTIIESIPGGVFHNGGRIGFGPDGMLYITTGETFSADLAKDISSLAGKILRITPEGDIPPDNPFGNSPVYSFGHRNPQGIAWHPETGALFGSEHGPSGEFGKFANDEINIIEKGGNYGWPDAIGGPGLKGMIDPIIVWKKTTPPSGMTFYSGDMLSHLKGDLFVATLKSEALIRIKFQSDKRRPLKIERWFAYDSEKGEYGRLRDVIQGPDGALYFLTSNKDGRGETEQGDDRIYRIISK